MQSPQLAYSGICTMACCYALTCICLSIIASAYSRQYGIKFDSETVGGGGGCWIKLTGVEGSSVRMRERSQHPIYGAATTEQVDTFPVAVRRAQFRPCDEIYPAAMCFINFTRKSRRTAHETASVVLPICHYEYWRE